MNALQVLVTVLAWFAIAVALAVALGRAVALADCNEGAGSRAGHHEARTRVPDSANRANGDAMH